MVTSMTPASRWPSFLQFIILIKLNIRLFFIAETLFFVVIKFFMVDVCLLVFTEVAMEI